MTLGAYGLNDVYLGDCIELMRDIPDKSVVTITDPVWPNVSLLLMGSNDPYGLFARAASEIERVSIRIAIQLGCASDPRFLSPLALPFFRVCWLDYAVPGKFNRLLNSGDVGYLFGPPPPPIQGRKLIAGRSTATTHSVGRDPRDSWNEHPCPRRLSHVEWLIHQWSDKDEIIFDPFMGSGTTAIAAENRGRHWIGFEIDPRWCAHAKDGIAASRAQQRMDI